MTREDIQRSLDNAHVSMSAHGKNALTGGPVDHLPPRLWDQLRVELQRRYRNATGEEQAVLSVEAPPAPQPRAVGDNTPSGDNIPCAVCGRETQAGGRHDFSSLFPSKTPEEMDQDPVYRKVHAEMASLRAALQEKDAGE